MINLKEKRRNKGLTQQQLAEKVFVTKTHIGNIETGYSRPSVEVAKSIASVLEFNWVEFFE